LIAGERERYLQKAEPVDIYDAKAAALQIIERVTGQRAQVASLVGEAVPAHLHPRFAGVLRVGESSVGTFGALHPEVMRAFDVEGSAFVVELDLVALEALGVDVPKYAPIPRLPAVTRDIALELRETVRAAEVEAAIVEAAGELCESVSLFDLFSGQGVREGHRSLAFRVVYRDPEAAKNPDKARTLTDKEVDKRHSQVVSAVTEKLGAALRA
jgi:phenylalanyl-tRNA synthetase beta chain